MDGLMVCLIIFGNYYFMIEDFCMLSIVIFESDGVFFIILIGSGCNGVLVIYIWYKDGVVVVQGLLSFI